MCSNEERIEKLFELTLDMDFEAIETFLSGLDPATRDEVMDHIIGSADMYDVL